MPTLPPISAIHIITILLLSLSLIQYSICQSISVQLTTTTINTNSIYKYSINDNRLMTTNGYIILSFPSSLYTLTSSTPSCYNTDSVSQTYTCTVSGSNNIIITYNKGTYPSPFLSLSISTIRNPSSKQSLNFTYAFSTTPTLITAQAYVYTNPLTPDTLQSCSISFSPSVVNTQSYAIVTITTKNILDTNSSITITLPNTWPNSVSSSSAYRPLQYSTLACNKISGTVLKSTLQCDVMLTDQKISVYQAFATNVPSSSVLSFNISRIRTPPTTSSSYTITISTQTSNGYPVDESSCTIAAVSEQTLSLTSSSNFIVGNSNILQMSWVTASALKVSDTITLTLPNTYMTYTQYSTSVIYYDNTKSIERSITVLSSQQIRYTITKLSGIDTQISSGSIIQISNVVVQCLIDASPRNIQVVIGRNGNNIANGVLAVTPNANVLGNVSVWSDVGVVSAPMALSVGFKTNNSLTSAAMIKIQVPNSIGLTGGSPTCVVSSSTTPSAILSSTPCTLSSYTITIPSFLQSTLPSSSSLLITISSCFKNPQTSQPTSSFIISTFSTSSSPNYLVDQHSSSTYTATPGTIGSISITPTLLTVSANSIYTIDYNITRSIKSGSSITVKLPSQIVLASVPVPSYSYMINNAGTYTSITPTITTTTTTLLTFAGIITTNLIAGNNIKIIINTLRNPLSLQPSSSFQISTIYNNYPIQTLTTGLTVTLTTMTQFKDVFALVALPTNGAVQDYTLYIKPSIAVNAGDIMTVEIVNNTVGNSNQLSYVSGIVSCPIYYNTSVINNVCSVSGALLTIYMASPLTDTTGITQYRLIISSITMSRIPTTTSKFKITTYTSNNFGVQSKQIQSITNTQPNKIQQLTLTIPTIPSQLNRYQQLRIYVKLYNGIDMANGQYLVLDVPVSFTYVGNASTVPICTNTIYTCSYYNNNNNAIKIAKSGLYTAIGYVKQFTITLNQYLYISPTIFNDYSTDYFYITSYTSSQLIIDKTYPTLVPLSRAYFYRSCGGKCKTCLSSNVSYCLSCYQLSDNDGYYSGINYGGYNTMTVDNQCVDACGTGYYKSGSTCNLCVTPCLACVSATECLSCRTGYYYVQAATDPNNKCVSSCLQRTYADTTTSKCISCATSCYNCTTTPTTCTSCSPGLFLSTATSTCQSSCTMPFTYQSTLTNKCQSCSLTCSLAAGCSANAADCIQCAAGYYRINSTSSTCVNSCPSGSVINTVTSTCQCSSSCLTCSNTLTYCTSCPVNKFLYSNTCISSCPSNTYLPTPSSISCIQCIDTHCIQCNSSSCLKCSNNYYLRLGTCITQCPQGTRLQNYQCKQCQQGCRVCLSSLICTSCYSPYLMQVSKCVSVCSTGYINYNATQCVTQCPIGYYNSSNKCQIINNNNTNNNTNNNNNNNIINNTSATVSYGKIIPFPYTISYVLIIGISIGMKCLYPLTLLPSVMMSLGSIVQVMSIITLIIVSYIQIAQLSTGIGILIITIVLIYLSNIINIILINKILHNDNKYMYNYKKSICGNVAIRIISTISYHKFHQIIFSNIFGIRIFCNKVDYVKRLYPFNVLLILSIFISVIGVIGASLISYSVQDILLGSSTFIQSVDAIIVIVVNVIPTILVLRRKDTEYEKDVNDSQAKRYQTQDQLNANNQSVGIEEAFIQESGALYGSKVSKVGNGNGGMNRKSYFYQNSKRSQSGDDPYQTPLDKKKIGANPMASGQEQDAEKSSQALMFGDKKKNKGMGDVQEISQGIQQIMLEQPTGDNAANPGRAKLTGKNKNSNTNRDKDGNVIDEDGNVRIDPMVNYTGYDLDPRLLQLAENSQQFKKLPSQTKAKIRLAKANLQINKNNLKDTISQDVQEIQLSPKKLSKNKMGDQLKGSLSNILDSSGAELMDQSMRKRNDSKLDDEESKRRSQSKSKSKSKSKQKDKNRSKSKSIQKAQKKKSVGNNVFENKKGDQAQKQDTEHENRMVRNRSQQIQKKQGKQQTLKTTKSQNIKKKKKNPNSQIKVLFNNGMPGATNSNEQNIGQQHNDEDYQYEDEPTLPVFKHKNNKNNEDSDGLGAIEQNQYGQRQKGKKNRLSDRRSQNLDDYNINNLRNMKGDRPMRNQQPDQLPQLHSSQQLGKLVVINKNRKTKDLQFSNDDSSIYKKIYNDDTETLKSVQGDNFFNQQISPSQFNMQNQRFQQTQASNDMPLPPTFDLDQGEGEDENENGGGTRNNRNGNKEGNEDGFDDELFQGNSNIKRYSSNHNIDYDSVLSKRVNNDRIKELEKIYLPRLEVVKPSRKKK